MEHDYIAYSELLAHYGCARPFGDPHRDRAVLLYGGPGLGKTVLLRRIASEVHDDDTVARKAAFFDGRTLPGSQHTQEVLFDTLREATSGWLLLDNFHVLVEEGEDEILDALEAFFGRRLDSQSHRDMIVIASSRIIPATAVDRRLKPLSSDFVLNYRVQLDPWRGEWRARVRATTSAIVSRLLGARSEHVGEVVSTIIVNLTGGHPAFLDAAFEALSCVGLGTLRAAKAELIEAFLKAALVPDATRWISKAFEEVERRHPDVFERLRDPRTDLGAVDTIAMGVLQNYGLAFSHAESEYKLKLVDGLVADAVGHLRSQGVNQPAQPPEESIVLQPSREAPEARGIVRRTTADGARHEVPLSAGPWKILLRVARSEGVIKLDSLSGRFKTKAAFDSALQRLREQLRSIGLDELVENVRPHGYRVTRSIVVEDGQSKARQ